MSTVIALAILLLFLVLLVFKFDLSPSIALTVTIAMFVGGLIDIPIIRIRRQNSVSSHPLAVYGLARFWPQAERKTFETIIAVNFGGCIVPVGLALYEIGYLATFNPRAVMLCIAGCLINIAACYFTARSVKGVGIALPPSVSVTIAFLFGILFVPDAASPVALVIGVSGPLIGADLLHLKDIEAAETGMASIGGAGTLDAIAYCGIVAGFLA